jgi:hypothetical protein
VDTVNGYDRAREEGLLGVWLVGGRGQRGRHGAPHPAPIPRHEYRGDGVLDPDGNDRCLTCKQGRDQGRAKEAHQPVVVDAAVQAVSDRMLGEGGGA